MTPQSTPELISVEHRDGIALVTIDRPEVRNALNTQVLEEIEVQLEHIRSAEEIGAVIFTGAGDTSFIAGADISQLVGYSMRDGLRASMQRLYDLIEEFPKPTIAAVNGYAFGGGCELSMACDIRIAAQPASFCLPETNLGVLPGAGGTQRLSRLVGKGRAVEMILTGRRLSAEEALGIGLVTSVTGPDELLEQARETARTILAKGPLAVELGKLVIRAGSETDQHTGLLLERLAQSLLYASPQKAEGAQAFLDKRPADFRGVSS